MKLAAGVVAILVAPLVVIAIDPHPETIFYKVALGGLLAVAIALMVVAFALQPKRGPDHPIDERNNDRYMNAAALFSAAVIAPMSMLLSASRLEAAPLICGTAIAWSLIWLPRFTRRFGVTTEVAINRDPKTVFNFMLDGRNQVQYVPDLVSVEKITPGDIGPGTQFLSKVRMDGTGVFEGTEEIVEVDWGQRIVDRVASGRLPNRGIMTFTAAPGGTLLTYRFESEVSYPSALLGQGAMRWALTGLMRRRRMEIWARLKQYLESQPAT